MGRGDKRTKKGKIFKGSYGVSRAHKVKGAGAAASDASAASEGAPKKAAKKATAKKKK